MVFYGFLGGGSEVMLCALAEIGSQREVEKRDRIMQIHAGDLSLAKEVWSSSPASPAVTLLFITVYDICQFLRGCKRSRMRKEMVNLKKKWLSDDTLPGCVSLSFIFHLGGLTCGDVIQSKENRIIKDLNVIWGKATWSNVQIFGVLLPRWIAQYWFLPLFAAEGHGVQGQRSETGWRPLSAIHIGIFWSGFRGLLSLYKGIPRNEEYGVQGYVGGPGGIAKNSSGFFADLK